ncbi:MAG: membrane fusion protein LapC [Rhodobacteraceae bacterium]|uniref:HlyD family type I secretion periplasmic adaptor subunit n=1 Tax=Cypionkella sp. TaxID=2811411 RepID=UPI001322C049|nr:HlyD family type I secretion periplasmic adaptor subunit [Cypionkella sp.]KAF0176208.1 MAG: membrane fusion protein LapC [Paracoccaceae bacterium]MDO8328622.1 HlyD family type I secretion periplasmic adaptor subunit [Cypionkella sp.]
MSLAAFDEGFAEKTRGPSRTIWMIILVAVVFVAWASVAWVDEIVRAQGEVVSSSRPQIIQNLEGGILAELNVAEGDIVEPGQTLARLYGTQYQAAVDELSDQIATLDIRRLRLEAEINGEPGFDVPDSIANRVPEVVASEKALLTARQSEFNARVEGAQAVLEQTSKELDLLEKMFKQDIAPLIEVTRARKANSDAKNKLSEARNTTEMERATEYSKTEAELASLRQKLKMAQDQLSRTLLVAPMRGVVNKLSITTIGGVVRPGEEILQIIPLDEALFIEARVKPRDIASVREGLSATVKLSAYDYTIYGSLKAKVTFISADTFKDERSRNPDGDPHYKVTLAVDRSQFTERQKGLEIRPGMQADVELETGGKTILTYLTKPLYKSNEALRER